MSVSLEESKHKYLLSYNDTNMEITVRLGEESAPIKAIYEMMTQQHLTVQDLYVSEIAELFMQLVQQMLNEKKNQTDNVLLSSEANSLMEFVLIAAQLLKEKARMLSNKYTNLAEYGFGYDDDEYFDDGDGYESPTVQEMLKGYIHDVEVVMEDLKERETLNRFFAKPLEQFQKAVISYIDFDLDKLWQAIVSVQGAYSVRQEQQMGVTIVKERSSVSGKVYTLKVLLTTHERMPINDLLEDTGSMDEKICLFLAILQLLKTQVAIVDVDGEGDKMENYYLCVNPNWDRQIDQSGGEKDEFDND